MNRRVRSRPGDFVALPLPSGGFGYGRVLEKLTAFYNYKSDTISDVGTVAQSKVALITAVHRSAFSSDRWTIIGFKPLEREFNEPREFFRKDPSGDGFLIYVSKPTPPSVYEEHKASAQECIGLEPLLVWDADQIEQRLEDQVLGRLNKHLAHYVLPLYKQSDPAHK